MTHPLNGPYQSTRCYLGRIPGFVLSQFLPHKINCLFLFASSSCSPSKQPIEKLRIAKDINKGHPGTGGTKKGEFNKYVLISQKSLGDLHSKSSMHSFWAVWIKAHNGCQSGNEATDVLNPTQKTSGLFLCFRCWHLCDGFHLWLVEFNSALTRNPVIC